MEYGVAMLEAFTCERQFLGIADLADILGISRSTIHRYAVTLVTLGYLEQDTRRKYRLARHAADSGVAVIGAIRSRTSAHIGLEELRNQTGHTVSMGMLDEARVIYIYCLFGHRRGQYAIDSHLGVGAHVSAHRTALGKALLASLSAAERSDLLMSIDLASRTGGSITAKSKLAVELDRIDPETPVVSDEELIEGARSIALLVPRPTGEPALAIDVTVPSSAYTVDQLKRQVGPPLKRAVKRISDG
jgi:DNA-binding IclR family transcriptional regulator